MWEGMAGAALDLVCLSALMVGQGLMLGDVEICEGGASSWWDAHNLS